MVVSTRASIRIDVISIAPTAWIACFAFLCGVDTARYRSVSGTGYSPYNGTSHYAGGTTRLASLRRTTSCS